MVSPVAEPTGSREKLVCVTAELIASQGYDATGINEILAKAEVTKSDFYYHFDSKEELCLEALECLIEHGTQELIQGVFLNQAHSPKKRFELFINKIYEKLDDCCCSQGCPMVNLATETSDFYPPFRQRLDQFFCDYTKAIEQWYQEGIEAGEFREDLEPKMVSQFVLSTLNGTMVMVKTLKDPSIIKNNGEAILKFILKN